MPARSRHRQINCKDLSLERRAVEHDDPALYDGATRRFGGWYRAVEQAGLDPSLWRERRTTRTREQILEQLRAAHARHGAQLLRRPSLLDRWLYRRAIAAFGSWHEALARAGIARRQ